MNVLFFSGGLFGIIPLLVIAGFAAVIGVIIAGHVKNARRWRANNEAPVLTVDAAVAAKRVDMRHNGAHNAPPYRANFATQYFATCEVVSGDRLELSMDGSQYGQLAENDVGQLTFQGARFLSFDRFKHT